MYLGAPMFLSRSPSEDFKFLLDKVEAKLSGWRSRCLSWAGRCTFINSLTQTIPNYPLSSFSILAKLCDKLDAFSRRFWWKPKSKEGRFSSWKKWDKLCKPKCAGGLGFKKTREVNATLLAKLSWMVASGNQSIYMEVLRAKYKVKEDWLRANSRKSSSPTWKAIERAKILIEKGACFLLEDGKFIDVWANPWVPWIEDFKPTPRIEDYYQLPIKAHHLLDHTSNAWNEDMVKEVFESVAAQAILTIPIPHSPRQDKLIWLPDSKGAFFVRSVH
ncbi:putative mitochondrial protein AtMg00310 [Castanea sativa]|uniref:putative mitochondrial protein AtMg00310 n=1 Tax=Castanea sativa TaxID=21020 RepID=UPI003F650A8B